MTLPTDPSSLSNVSKTWSSLSLAYQPQKGPLAPLLKTASNYIAAAQEPKASTTGAERSLQRAQLLLNQAIQQAAAMTPAAQRRSAFEQIEDFGRAHVQKSNTPAVAMALQALHTTIRAHLDSFVPTAPTGNSLPSTLASPPDSSPPFRLAQSGKRLVPSLPTSPPSNGVDDKKILAQKIKLKTDIWQDLMPKDYREQRVGLEVDDGGQNAFITGRIMQTGALGAGRPACRVTPPVDLSEQSHENQLFVKEFRMTQPRNLQSKSNANSLGSSRTKISQAQMADKEVDHLKRFTRIKVHAYIKTENKRYVVIDRMSSGDAFDACLGLPSETLRLLARNWSMTLGEDIQRIHNQNYVHGDIKTENVFVDAPSRNVVLGDVGSAQPCKADSVADPAKISGTLFPPEWAQKVNPRFGKPADVWAYGLSMLDLINSGSTGVVNPFQVIRNEFGRPDLAKMRKMFRAFAEWYDSAQVEPGQFTPQGIAKSIDGEFKAYFLNATRIDSNLTDLMLSQCLDPKPEQRQSIDVLVKFLKNEQEMNPHWFGQPLELSQAYDSIAERQGDRNAVYAGLERVAQRLRPRLADPRTRAQVLAEISA